MTDGLRKAALYLHGVSKTDRAWLLEKLPETDRQELQRLLVELSDLGIPSEPFIEHLRLPDDSAGKVVASGVVSSSAYAALKDADAEIVVRLLAKEPAAIISALIRVADWHWTQAVLDASSEMRRRQITALLNAGSPVSVRVQKALLEALADRVVSAPSSQRITESRRVVKTPTFSWWGRRWQR